MCSYFKGKQTWESIKTFYIKCSSLYHLRQWFAYPLLHTIRATNRCFMKTKKIKALSLL